MAAKSKNTTPDPQRALENARAALAARMSEREKAQAAVERARREFAALRDAPHATQADIAAQNRKHAAAEQALSAALTAERQAQAALLKAEDALADSAFSALCWTHDEALAAARRECGQLSRDEARAAERCAQALRDAAAQEEAHAVVEARHAAGGASDRDVKTSGERLAQAKLAAKLARGEALLLKDKLADAEARLPEQLRASQARSAAALRERVAATVRTADGLLQQLVPVAVECGRLLRVLEQNFGHGTPEAKGFGSYAGVGEAARELLSPRSALWRVMLDEGGPGTGFVNPSPLSSWRKLAGEHGLLQGGGR